MRSLFWTGKLSLPVLLLVNANNLIAFLNGNSGNKTAMKERIKLGYEGAFSNHVTRYDSLAAEYQKKAAIAQLSGMDLKDKEIIDIGCGSGIISLLALEMGVRTAVCGDISEYMLKLAEENSRVAGYDSTRISFCQLDAESLPFEDNCFDAVITGMSFGLFPDQEKAVREMYRILKPGGLVSLGAHGPEHYWEAIDTNIRALDKRHVLGYRFEFWPRTERQIVKLMKTNGFRDIQTNRFIWRNLFSTPSDACDFFAAVSSNWWYAKIPEQKRDHEYDKVKQLFERRGIRRVTDDVIIGYGEKPSSDS
ncbi:MAG: methyltransferase domain-containing protein [Bacteroidales bacterium]|nr:methyltransferase domain-containing protein [Bacteroidales bacterium]MDT8402205.1 methyltransferase domain-containing protein [Bacteroidales bacterium]